MTPLACSLGQVFTERDMPFRSLRAADRPEILASVS